MNTRNQAKKRSLFIGGLGFVLAAGTVAFSAAGIRGGSNLESSNAFWAHFHPKAVEGTTFPSLEAMAGEAEVIVVGAVEGVSLSRQWVAVEEWGEDGIATLIRTDIQVERIIKGDPALMDGAVSFELFLASPSDTQEVLAQKPKERAIYFLVQKKDASGAYRLASTQGYLRDFGHAEPPAVTEDDWLNDLKRFPFEDVLQRVDSEIPES